MVSTLYALASNVQQSPYGSAFAALVQAGRAGRTALPSTAKALCILYFPASRLLKRSFTETAQLS